MSTGVEQSQILEWKMDWSCLAGQQNHTRTLTQSPSFDLPVCFILFYDENSMNILFPTPQFDSTPLLHSKTCLTGLVFDYHFGFD